MAAGKDAGMNLKIIGAALIVLGCGSWGFGIASNHLRKIRLFRQVLSALDYMHCELQYRCTPLPLLCRQAGEREPGKIGKVFIRLASEIEEQICPDVQCCMSAALSEFPELPDAVVQLLAQLGNNLGNFDLDGQLMGLEKIRMLCNENLGVLLANKDARVRSYQTLGLCAGAALAILLV